MIRNGEGAPLEVVGSWSDITARKEAEAARAAAQARQALLLTSAPAVIYSFEAKGEYRPTFVSRNIKDLFGYEPAEYLENPDFWRQRVHPGDSPPSKRVRAFVRARPPRGRIPLPKKDGGYCCQRQFQSGRCGQPSKSSARGATSPSASAEDAYWRSAPPASPRPLAGGRLQLQGGRDFAPTSIMTTS
jgi:PAS domain-containing protein